MNYAVGYAKPRSIVTQPDVLRAVATLAPQGEWVTAYEVARVLHATLAEVAEMIDTAVRNRMLNQELDEWGILWIRPRIRRT